MMWSLAVRAEGTRGNGRRSGCSAWPWFPAAVLVALGSHAIHAQTVDSLTPEQVVREVLERNDRVVAARYMETASRKKVAPAGAWEDPMLMVGVSNLPTSLDFKMDPMTMTMIGISQRIPYAGDKGLQSKAAEAEALAATQDRQATEVDLARAARYAFADLYYRSRTVADLVTQAELLQSVVASAQAKLATNQAGQDEVLSAQAEVWRLEARTLEAEHMADEARYDLNQLRGLDVRSDIPPLAEPTQIPIPEQPDVWIAAALNRYPMLLKLRHQGEAYRLAGAAEGRMRWPMLELSAYYGFRFDSETEPRDDMIGFQASFPLPIFGVGKQSGMAASMDAMSQGVDAEALQMARELEARLRVLHTTARHLQYTLELYHKRILPTSRQAFESALSGYAANQVPFTNLLLLASDVYRDRLAFIETGDQLARTLADVRSFTEGVESPTTAAGEKP